MKRCTNKSRRKGTAILAASLVAISGGVLAQQSVDQVLKAEVKSAARLAVTSGSNAQPNTTMF